MGSRLEARLTDVRKFCRREKVELIARRAASFVVETELDLLDGDIPTIFGSFFLEKVGIVSHSLPYQYLRRMYGKRCRDDRVVCCRFGGRHRPRSTEAILP